MWSFFFYIKFALLSNPCGRFRCTHVCHAFELTFHLLWNSVDIWTAIHYVWGLCFWRAEQSENKMQRVRGWQQHHQSLCRWASFNILVLGDRCLAGCVWMHLCTCACVRHLFDQVKLRLIWANLWKFCSCNTTFIRAFMIKSDVPESMFVLL